MITRIRHAFTGFKRHPSSVAIFRKASRFRDEGRFEEAAELVANGLRLHPNNMVGHMLSGQLHFIFREMPAAKVEYERVLSFDAHHPRALLGLARIALEESNPDACRELLVRALDRYSDFPEAQALLDVMESAPPAGVGLDETGVATLLAERLRVPAEIREVLLTRTDASLIFAQPGGSRTDELAKRTAHVVRLAAAITARAGAGTLERGVIEGAAETTYLRSGAGMLFTLTLGRDVDFRSGFAHLDRHPGRLQDREDSTQRF